MRIALSILALALFGIGMWLIASPATGFTVYFPTKTIYVGGRTVALCLVAVSGCLLAGALAARR